ncbi:MAG: glycosyltransferase [Acidimicrobiales bacterium]
MTNGDSELDVVICTFDNDLLLDRALGALARQRGAPGPWNVLVVDNNSGPATRDVIDRHISRGDVPGLRRVAEPAQGLTQARVRGVHSTTAPWIAFVDDDCLLGEDWVRGAIEFARSNPGCGAFGGRVVPTYAEVPPAFVARYGWAFAEQDLGDGPAAVDCLVGAGMVVNRTALAECGWAAGPYFADRVGRRLVSGGDVEIALRLAGTGRPLWYTPACELQHLIPARRTEVAYLVRMTRGLGVSHSLARALTWHGSRRAWLRAESNDLVGSLVSVIAAATRAVRGPESRRDALLAASYEWGRCIGAARVAVLLSTGRCPFFGGDRPGGAQAGRRGHAVRAG